MRIVLVVVGVALGGCNGGVNDRIDASNEVVEQQTLQVAALTARLDELESSNTALQSALTAVQAQVTTLQGQATDPAFLAQLASSSASLNIRLTAIEDYARERHLEARYVFDADDQILGRAMLLAATSLLFVDPVVEETIFAATEYEALFPGCNNRPDVFFTGPGCSGSAILLCGDTIDLSKASLGIMDPSNGAVFALRSAYQSGTVIQSYRTFTPGEPCIGVSPSASGNGFGLTLVKQYADFAPGVTVSSMPWPLD